MSEPLLVMGLLAVSVLCLVTLVMVVLVTARDFRQTLRKINEVVPQAGRTLQEARRSLEEAHQLLARANVASQKVEAVVHGACDAISGTLSQLTLWRKEAGRFLKGHGGNGAGADPRRHHRRR